ARELGVRRNQLYKWKDQLSRRGEKAFPGHGRRSCLILSPYRPFILDGLTFIPSSKKFCFLCRISCCKTIMSIRFPTQKKSPETLFIVGPFLKPRTSW